MYITTTELSNRMGVTDLADLIDVTGPNGTALVAQYVAIAESTVNGYASRLYQIPLPDSALVKNWCFVIAEYEIHKRGQGSDMPEKYRKAYEDAIKQLVDVAKGDLFPPPDEDGNMPTSRNAVGFSMDFDSDTQLFSETCFNGTDEDTPSPTSPLW